MTFSKSAIAMALVLSGQAYAASYQAIDIQPAAITRATSAVAIDNQGNAALNSAGVLSTGSSSAGYGFYKFPIDYLTLDYESTSIKDNENLDLEKIKNGQITATEQNILLAVLQANSSNAAWQKIGGDFAWLLKNNQLAQLTGFDTFTGVNGGYTWSTDTQVKDLVDGVAVINGSAPWQRTLFTPAPTETTPNPSEVPYYVRAFRQRAAVINASGEMIEIPGVINDYGSYSLVNGISKAEDGSYWLAGVSAIQLVDGFKTTVDEQCTGALKPVVACQQDSLASSFTGFIRRATLWHLNADFSVRETKSFELPYSIPEDVSANQYYRFYHSAIAVNASGQAIGNSALEYSGSTYPVVFTEGTAVGILNKDDWTGGLSSDINDIGLVVGFGTKKVQGLNKTRSYMFNVNTSELTELAISFSTANVYAQAINNSGLVVGRTEIDNGTLQRPTVGFIYDSAHSDSNWQDLNKLLSCEQRQTIRVVDAIDVNESGEIVVNTVITNKLRDALGEVVKDDSGNDKTEEVVRAMVLKPIAGGSVDTCATDVAEGYQRQSGTTSWPIVMMFSLLWFLRRKTTT